MRRLALAVLTYLLLAAPGYAATTHVITEDPGGIIASYVAKFWQWNQDGDTVRIEGTCVSACTILLGLMDPERVCATRNAEFGFHSASYGTTGIYSEHGTHALWMFYEQGGRVARVLKAKGWDGPSYHPALLIIDAQEIVRPCRWEDYHG